MVDGRYEGPVLYTDEQLEALDGHCERFFGSPERVFYELMSFDIHVDVPVVPPKDARPWITLVTQGAGARVMNVPDGLDPEEWGRAEYLICLPPDWGSFEKAYMGDFQ